jgi:integrase
MNLKEAFDFVGDMNPNWKGKAGWHNPFKFNREHALRLIGANKSVKRIKKADLAQMRGKLLQETIRGGKRRSPGGVNRIMSMIQTLLKELEEHEIIDKAYRLKPLQETGARKEWFTEEQIEQMCEAAVDIYDHPHLADAIRFGVFTGCRQDELLSLTVEDCNITQQVITFRDVKQGGDHIIDMHPSLTDILSRLCEHKNPEDKVFNFRNDDELRRDFYKCRDYIGASKKLVWHSLRHTTGTWLSKRGVPIQVIAKVLGHKQITTSQRYTKVADESRKSAINSL